MINKKLKIKSWIAILLFMVAILLLLYTVPMSTYAFHNQDTVQSSEKNNLISQVTVFENATNLNINIYSTLAREVKESRTLILNDLYDNDTYLYMEFVDGGYAIYDRNEKFIYERTQSGLGPYSNQSVSDKLYYGGPGNYYIKEMSSIKDLKTYNTISKKLYKSISENLNTIQQKNAEASMLINDLEIIPKQHLLGESYDSPGQLYFPLMAMLKWQTVDINKKRVNIYPSYDGDVLYASNERKSCGFVALGQVLQYYTRMRELDSDNINKYPKLVPDSASSFRKMYDFQGRVLDDNGNIIDISNKEAYKGEYLQQELMNIAFNGNPQDKYTLDLNSLEKLVKDYFAKYGNSRYSLKTRLMTMYADTNIKKGNPVFMVMKNGDQYTQSGGVSTLTDGHIAVAYGYMAVGPFVQEYICNFGWQDENTCIVYINSNVPSHNASLNII